MCVQAIRCAITVNAEVLSFVAFEKSGDPAMDWYLDQYGGGFMISAENFGRVFLTSDDIDESLQFVARSLQNGEC
jgi:hypothetical protein